MVFPTAANHDGLGLLQRAPALLLFALGYIIDRVNMWRMVHRC